MKRNLVLASLALALLATDATAGPILDCIRARRAARAQGCQQQGVVQQPLTFAAPAVQTEPRFDGSVMRSLYAPFRTAGSCAGGYCPAK